MVFYKLHFITCTSQYLSICKLRQSYSFINTNTKWSLFLKKMKQFGWDGDTSSNLSSYCIPNMLDRILIGFSGEPFYSFNTNAKKVFCNNPGNEWFCIIANELCKRCHMILKNFFNISLCVSIAPYYSI